MDYLAQYQQRLQRVRRGRERAREVKASGVCPLCGHVGWVEPDLDDPGRFACGARCGYEARTDGVRTITRKQLETIRP